jgi:hypothetical protein
MNMRLVRCFGALAALLMASGAWGATVILDGTKATGILGLDVLGQKYDIQFQYDSFAALNVGGNFPFIGDLTSASVTVNAIADALDSAGALTVGDSTESLGLYSVPISDTQAVEIVQGTKNPPPDNWENTNSVNQTDRDNAEMYVTMTPVPIPPAVWLFGSALGLLGWIRKRAN